MRKSAPLILDVPVVDAVRLFEFGERNLQIIGHPLEGVVPLDDAVLQGTGVDFFRRVDDGWMAMATMASARTLRLPDS